VVGEHSVNLSLHGRTDVVIAGERDVPVVAGNQQRPSTSSTTIYNRVGESAAP
jgi:hypothetical protein